jgi:prevent-host-death family protein
METISIREPQEKTGEYIRKAAEAGEIYVTDRGKTVARIVPDHDQAATPYFARR